MKRFIQKMKAYLNDNRGLTLIELLIAITILGIASAPLLHSFLSSANTSLKSQEMGRVTAVAQNIMEIVETQELNDVLAADASLFGGTNCIVTSNAGVDQLKVSDISVGNKKYHALIEINSEKYNDTINDIKLTQYTAMDAVFHVPANIEAGDRTITIEVVDGTNANEIQIKGNYTIGTVSEDATQTPDAGAPAPTPNMGTFTYTIQSGKLPAVYLLYYPNYYVNAEGTLVPQKDLIKIINKQDYAFDLFLVKMANEEIAPAVMVTGENESYCHVEQYLTNVYHTTNNRIGANIYSNISEHLGYTTGYTGYTDETHKPMPTGCVKYDIICGAEGATPTKVPGIIGTDTFELLVKEEADSEKRAYEYKVQIFDNSSFTGDALCTMTGTKLK